MEDYKLGICRWCADKTEVFRNNNLCHDCDSDTVYCCVCKSRVSSEYKCRHVFRDEYFEWHGAGFAPDDSEMKIPFHQFLSVMGEEFALDLKTAIKSGKFYTWMIAPMIGAGGLLEVNGMPDRDGKWMGHEWGDKIIKLGESERADRFRDGYRWLVSLYKAETAKANRTTINWIDQWLWPFAHFDGGAGA